MVSGISVVGGVVSSVVAIFVALPVVSVVLFETWVFVVGLSGISPHAARDIASASAKIRENILFIPGFLSFLLCGMFLLVYPSGKHMSRNGNPSSLQIRELGCCLKIRNAGRAHLQLQLVGNESNKFRIGRFAFCIPIGNNSTNKIEPRRIDKNAKRRGFDVLYLV